MYNQLCTIVEACIKLQINVVFGSTFFYVAKVTIICIRRFSQIWQQAKYNKKFLKKKFKHLFYIFGSSLTCTMSRNLACIW
jgi:hypothetical protein